MDFASRRPDNVVVCDLVKLFLRELPDPLFTFALYDAFVATASMCIGAFACVCVCVCLCVLCISIYVRALTWLCAIW